MWLWFWSAILWSVPRTGGNMVLALGEASSFVCQRNVTPLIQKWSTDPPQRGGVLGLPKVDRRRHHSRVWRIPTRPRGDERDLKVSRELGPWKMLAQWRKGLILNDKWMPKIYATLPPQMARLIGKDNEREHWPGSRPSFAVFFARSELPPNRRLAMREYTVFAAFFAHAVCKCSRALAVSAAPAPISSI